MKIITKIILPCSKATEYIERNRDRDLNLIERLQLKLHLAVCGLCRIYDHQSDKIHTLIQHFHQTKIIETPNAETVKAKILQKVGGED